MVCHHITQAQNKTAHHNQINLMIDEAMDKDYTNPEKI